jgi:signal recognition particle subunit SRP54
MFDTLSDRLRKTLAGLTGRGRISEADVDAAMREIRLSLLEADVNFKVVKDFIARVRERAIGADVLASLTAGQQVVAIVHEELIALLSGGDRTFHLQGNPAVVLVAGLQGSGKTTSTAKLARHVIKLGRRPMLVAADPYRPNAADQLETLGRSLDVPVYRAPDGTSVVDIARAGVEAARRDVRDTVIVDTAGRLHVDSDLMDELVRVRNATKPQNVLMVLDAMTGQDAVNVAEQFLDAVDFDGVILTKLDGDARGGAALSVRAVTGKPIVFASVGEKLDALEEFHPDRMASRILGMGDVLTLIERAQEQIDEGDALELERKLKSSEFGLDDLLDQLRRIRKMGSMRSLLGMIPGIGKQVKDMQVDEKQIDRVEAMILSMTPSERRNPSVIDGSRRRRIASGSGTSVQQVNQLLQQHRQMKKMMKQVAAGGTPPAMGGAPVAQRPRAAGSRSNRKKRRR